MNIHYRKSCLFIGRDTDQFVQGELATCPGGYFVTNTDGTVVSVQPDGSVDTRPAGTNPGAYEICQVDSSINVLRFSGAGTPYAVPYHG